MKATSKIGAHVSIAGGVDKAPARAAEIGCETFQCFTRSPQGGPAPALTDEIIANFKSEMKSFDFDRFHIHTPYYLNFASTKNHLRKFSGEVLREELDRGTLLGAKFVMTHLGSHADQTLKEGMDKVAETLKETLTGYKGSTELLLEISAGSGNIIGASFEEIGEIIQKVNGNLPPHSSMSVGVCFDTCHAFASGYDFRTKETARAMLADFDKHIGLHWLKLTHVNDSMFDLADKRDRHEHIGKGFIGKEGMAELLKTPEFVKIDWIVETPDDDRENDIEILKKIRG
ncbi:MAG: deoxyribonuclease IV [Minisyncoccia bacterium]|jgi:deoxyribonuclease-4